jgi:hypothetical protein
MTLHERSNNPIIVGITGSRDGWSKAQSEWFLGALDYTPISEFHFGACRGVDEAAYFLWSRFTKTGIAHAWPATISTTWDSKWVMTLSPSDRLIVHEPMYPLSRNIEIVKLVDELWAFPKDMRPAGGTWHTITHARKHGIPVHVIPRHGDVQ